MLLLTLIIKIFLYQQIFMQKINSHRNQDNSGGFTLIELSIVLVIIGLIVGSVLSGRDLIFSAEMRGQIKQIEQFNIAANAFRIKYNYLPGDIPEPYSSQVGLQNAMYTTTHGDGDGLVENENDGVFGFEAMAFWADLKKTGFIENKIEEIPNWGYLPTESPLLTHPEAKIGNGNYLSLVRGGVFSTPGTSQGTDGKNYITINDRGFLAWNYPVNPMVSPYQAFSIDQKMDDGLPQTGNVIAARWRKDVQPACCITFSWAGTNVLDGTNPRPSTAATASSSSTCYDNNNTAGAVQKYSMSQNGGNGINCGLSFKLQ